jgi:hypothetical protein
VGTFLTILIWVGGILLLLLFVVVAMFVRDELRLKKKKRRRWALAVGLPARIAALERSERDTKIKAPDPEIHLSICNSDEDKVWLKEQIVRYGAQIESKEQGRAIALDRIRYRLTNRTSHKMGLEPVDGYSIRDAIAWDSAMLIEEARLAQTLGWLDEDEVWGVVFLNAQRVQDTFESWRDFTDAAVAGREYELRYHYRKYATPSVAAAVAQKYESTISSFSVLPWRDFRILSEADFAD